MRKKDFYERDTVIPPADPQISSKQMTMLRNIKAIFDKHHTNYKIIISPLYDQIALNSRDNSILQNIFGQNTIFNF